MSLPRYPKYKESGAAWLSQVPEDWATRRIKDTTYLKGRVGWKGLTSEEYLESGYAYLVTGTDFAAKFISWHDCHCVELARYEDDPFIQLRNGDLLITKDGTIGKLALVADLDQPACLNSGIFLVRPKNSYTTAFMYWVLSSDAFRVFCDLVSLGSTIQHLYQNVFERFVFPAPSIEEQDTIAAFLDRETAKIDALVFEQQRLMELLKEKRQAVICHAVTKGLNPNIPLKPTGNDWFTEVPQHWQQGPMKRYWEVIDCKHVTVPFLEEGIPVASVMEVRSFDLDLSQALKTSEESFRLLSDGGRQPVRGDVIYCRNTANTGTSAWVGTDQKIALGQDVCLIKSSGRNGRYLNFILQSGFMAAQLDTLMVGSTFKRINVAEIRGLLVPCPPKSEQDDIAVFLDAETEKFDTLTAEAQRAIDLLQERRTALISAAVTGQIDVRAAA